MKRFFRVIKTLESQNRELKKSVSQIMFSSPEKIVFILRNYKIAATLAENNLESGIERLGYLTQNYQRTDSKKMKKVNLCYDNVAYVY